MRLFAKMFLCITFLLSTTLLLSGYLLIAYSYENAIKQESKKALNQFQYDKFVVQTGLLASEVNLQEEIVGDDLLLGRISSDLGSQSALFSEDKSLLFSDIPVQTDLSILEQVSDNSIIYEFQKIDTSHYIIVCGKITQRETAVYLMIAEDISQLVLQKEVMVQTFEQVYLITLGISLFLVIILSVFFTRPINKLTKSADRIAKGNYGDRLTYSSGDEMGELSRSFNLMADAIEDKINKLSENARQKEEFIASFAHELKTPMTSVIGYADMLYQKDLSPEDVKKAAWYILNEGLRLESLSLKLMDLIVLNKQEFVLEEMTANELLQNVVYGLNILFEEKKVVSHLEADFAYIKVEYDLFKTLLLNLIDNSIKAGSSTIWISGRKRSNYYCITVRDNGRGIPASEINRITEAFYTVDKSRFRKQHGIGLGLALAARIAVIHGSELQFKSSETEGTTVEIQLCCKGDESDA